MGRRQEETSIRLVWTSSLDVLSHLLESSKDDIFEGLINGKAAIAHTEPDHFEKLIKLIPTSRELENRSCYVFC